ncbi:MIP/aquaporin family protein [Plantactinospora sp. CA-294935]|uniref:MIP/aquaporin family protein n=1 Tax=Plantactinospora sp. CA-294935 TaxID=3240012 RepID=UPI003D90DE4B
MSNAKRYGAELLGTLLLVFFGVGSAIAARVEGGVVVVALAFGFVLLVLVYLLGPISGCHVNPAVTLGALLTGRISSVGAIGYWIAQFVGATIGALLLWILVEVGGVKDQSGGLGTNGYGANINLGGTFLLEIVLTFLLVLVVLTVTSRVEQSVIAGVAIGIAIAVCHLVGVALDGTSVNPARSFGPALFEGGTALSQLWVFIVAPLIGGVLAALVLRFVLGPGWRPAMQSRSQGHA